VTIAMNVEAKPKDKAIVSLVETEIVSRLTRLRRSGTNAFVDSSIGQKIIIEYSLKEDERIYKRRKSVYSRRRK
jgi:hypothetical protein